MIQDSTYTVAKDILEKLGGDVTIHYDSTYSICLAILEKLGGDITKKYDSIYSIVEAILPLAGEGGKCNLDVLKVIANGNYNPGEGFDGFSSVEVAVPEQKPEEVGNETIVENGKVKFTPTEGSVFSEMNVDVQVPLPALEERTTKEITRNGNYTVGPTINPETSRPYDGMKLCDINVNIPVQKDPKFIKLYPGTTFKYCTWTDFPWTEVDATSMTNMQYMFYCNALTTVPLFNTQNVTDMQYMFYNCTALTTVPLFNTQNVTNMNNMFEICRALTAVPQFDTSNVTNMSHMFNGCSKLTTVPSFNTQNVTNMNSMFSGCSKLTTVPSFNTQNVTNMNYMLDQCSSITSFPLFDIKNVTSMNCMIRSCTSLTSVRFKNGHSGIDCGDMFTHITTTGRAYLYLPGDYSDIIKALPTTWDTRFIGTTDANIRILKDGNWLTGVQNSTINNQELQYTGKGLYKTSITANNEQEADNIDYNVMLDNNKIGEYNPAIMTDQVFFTGDTSSVIVNYEGNQLATLTSVSPLPTGWSIAKDGEIDVLKCGSRYNNNAYPLTFDKVPDGDVTVNARMSRVSPRDNVIIYNVADNALLCVINTTSYKDYKFKVTGGKGIKILPDDFESANIKKITVTNLPPYPNDSSNPGESGGSGEDLIPGAPD